MGVEVYRSGSPNMKFADCAAIEIVEKIKDIVNICPNLINRILTIDVKCCAQHITE
jgi:hypothetical protein